MARRLLVEIGGWESLTNFAGILNQCKEQGRVTRVIAAFVQARADPVYGSRTEWSYN